MATPESVDWGELGYKSFEDYQAFVKSIDPTGDQAVKGPGTTATLVPLKDSQLAATYSKSLRGEPVSAQPAPEAEQRPPALPKPAAPGAGPGQGPLSIPGAELQARYGVGKISGLATWFHYNPDGSKDKDDPNPVSAFGYNLDDRSLAGVAVPVDILERTFGKFTVFNHATGTYDALNTPEAQAIRERIKGTSVTVTAPDGSQHVFPIVDIQGSLAGHPGHVLDLTAGAAHAMGLTDNAQLSYELNPGAVANWAAAENKAADQSSLLALYRNKHPEDKTSLSDDELLASIGKKFYPKVPSQDFQRLARLPGGTAPVQKYLDKDRSPIERFRARFPQYADMNDQQLTQRLWDKVMSPAQKAKWYPAGGALGDFLGLGIQNFRNNFAPNPWVNQMSAFLRNVPGAIPGGAIAGKEHLEGALNTGGDIINGIAKMVGLPDVPNQIQGFMKKGWEGTVNYLGPGPFKDLYEADRAVYKRFWDWIGAAAKAEGQKPPEAGLGAAIGRGVGQAIGQAPAAVVSWGPFAEAPVASILWGTAFELAATAGEEKQRGEFSLADVGTAGFTRALQGMIFHSPAGKIATGFMMAAAGTGTQDAKNWLEAKVPNSLDDHIAQMTLDFALAAMFKNEPHTKAVQEEFDAAKEAKLAGDVIKAREHIDRAGVLMSSAEQQKVADTVKETVQKQAGDAIPNPFKKKEAPKPKITKGYQAEISASKSWIAAERKRAAEEEEARKYPKTFIKESAASRAWIAAERAKAAKEAQGKKVAPEEPAEAPPELPKPEPEAPPEPPPVEPPPPEIEKVPQRPKEKRLAWKTIKDPLTGKFIRVEGTLKPEFRAPTEEAPPPPELPKAKPESVSSFSGPKGETWDIKYDAPNESFYVLRDGQQIARFSSEADALDFIKGSGGRAQGSPQEDLESYNFGLGDIGSMLKSIFSRDESETRDNLKNYLLSQRIRGARFSLGELGTSWLKLWSPQHLAPSAEFARHADPIAGEVTPAEHLRASIVTQNEIRRLSQQRQVRDWISQMKLEDKLRFDSRDIAKRETFWDQFSNDQLRYFTQKGTDTGNPQVDAMNRIYHQINQHWREFDMAAGNSFDLTRGLLQSLVKNSADLEDVIAQFRAAGIDPERVDPQSWNDLLDTLTNLKTTKGKPVELRTYNPERIMQARGDESSRMARKGEVIARGADAGYILDSDSASDWAKAHWPRVYGGGGEPYWMEPSAFATYQNAFYPSRFEAGGAGLRILGTPFRLANQLKQKTLGLKLWSPAFHAVNVIKADLAGRWTVALGRWNTRGGSSGDLFGEFLNTLTGGLKGIAETTRGQDKVYEYLRGDRDVGWHDLNDSERTQVTYLHQAGIGVRISQEREAQFLPWKSAHSANKLLNDAYNIVGNWAGIKKWIFGEMIPHLKVAGALREIKALLDSNPALSDPKNENVLNQHLLKIGDAIDTRYSEANWDNIFWDKTLKQAVISTYLAAGWDLGFYRMNAGAIHDLTTNMSRLDQVTKALRQESGMPEPRSRRLTNRVIFAAQYNFISALQNALITAAFTGGVKSAMDLFYPRIGQKPDGSPERIKTPGWTDAYAQLWRHGPLQTFVANKLSPPVAAAIDLAKNMDYAGNEIYATGPIENLEDLAGRIRDVLGFAFGGVIEPMPLEATGRTDISLGVKVLGVLGLGGPAPSWTERSELENRIMDEFRRYHGGKTPRAEVEVRSLKRQYAQALSRGDDPLARSTAIQLHKADPSAKLPRIHSQTQSAAQSVFHKLPARSQVRYLTQMSKSDQAIWWRYASKDAKTLFSSGQ